MNSLRLLGGQCRTVKLVFASKLRKPRVKNLPLANISFVGWNKRWMRRCRAAAAAYRGFSVGIIKKMACCRRRTPPQNVTVMRDKAVRPSVSLSLHVRFGGSDREGRKEAGVAVAGYPL